MEKRPHKTKDAWSDNIAQMSSSSQNNNNNSINIIDKRAAERHIWVNMAAEQYRTDYEHAQSWAGHSFIFFQWLSRL